MESPGAWSDKHPQSRDSDVRVFPFLELTAAGPGMSKFILWAHRSACYYKMSWKQELQLLAIAREFTPAKHHPLAFSCFKLCWLHSSLWWDWQWKLPHSVGAPCRENGSLDKIMGFLSWELPSSFI